VTSAVCHQHLQTQLLHGKVRHVSIYKDQDDAAYLLLYVNDNVLTMSSPALLQRTTDHLTSEFAMTNLGALHHFLGISVTRSPNSLLLSDDSWSKLSRTDNSHVLTPQNTEVWLVLCSTTCFSFSNTQRTVHHYIKKKRRVQVGP
jgi:hypothetical protein